jgi:hypothetical protein
MLNVFPFVCEQDMTDTIDLFRKKNALVRIVC